MSRSRRHPGASRAVFVHPRAIVDSRAVGRGTRVWAFAHVCAGAVVGADCNIGEGCYVEGGSRLGDRVTVKNGVMVWEGVSVADDVFIGPGVVFTNDLRPRSPRAPAAAARYRTKAWLSTTTVGRGASIGANATIGSGITIGEFAMVGAGAVVTSDVAAHAVAFGVPARARGWACACGARLDFTRGRAACADCGTQYLRVRGGVTVATSGRRGGRRS